MEPKALGGKGSGNFGHAGRPGAIGGSGEGEADAKAATEKEVKALNEVRYQVKNRHQGYGRPEIDETRQEYGRSVFSVRDFGVWENPPDMEDDEDDEDYDWKQPTKETVDQLNELTAKITKEYGVDVSWSAEEKNWISFYAEAKGKKGRSAMNPSDFESKTEQPLSKREIAELALRTMEAMERAAGGKGSGNFGHAGRPGAIGGSGEGEGAEKLSKLKDKESIRVQLTKDGPWVDGVLAVGSNDGPGTKSVFDKKGNQIDPHDWAFSDKSDVEPEGGEFSKEAAKEATRAFTEALPSGIIKEVLRSPDSVDPEDVLIRAVYPGTFPEATKDLRKAGFEKTWGNQAYAEYSNLTTGAIATLDKSATKGDTNIGIRFHRYEATPAHESDPAWLNAMHPDTRAEVQKESEARKERLRKFKGAGGPGSGNFGHAGRPGEVGGSSSDGGDGGQIDAQIAKPSSEYPPARADGLDTQERFKVGGQYTPERKALHAAIVQKMLQGKTPVVGRATATVLGGGPASGKSSLEKAEGISEGNVVLVNPDAIKELLPEFTEGKGNKQVSSLVHEESSDISKALTDAAVKGNYNLVLDGTGDSSVEKLGGKIAVMRAGGHEVIGKYVSLPTNMAVELAQARGDKMVAEGKTGRYVPETYLRETHRAVSGTFEEALKQGLFDRADLYDTTEYGNMRKVVSAVGKDVTIHDQALWETFLAKKNESWSTM